MTSDDIGITLTLAAFFGIPSYLAHPWWLRTKGPQGSLVCIECGGVSLYAFATEQLASGQDLLVRDRQTGEVQLIQLL